MDEANYYSELQLKFITIESCSCYWIFSGTMRGVGEVVGRNMGHAIGNVSNNDYRCIEIRV